MLNWVNISWRAVRAGGAYFPAVNRALRKGTGKKGMKFLSIGYGNAVAADRIVMIASPDSSPVKRLVAAAKDHNRVIDVSSGRKTRSVIVTDSEHIILSAVQVDTLASRLGAELVEDQPD